MKPIKILLLLSIILSAAKQPSSQISYSLSKDYTVTILGTSNLHNWKETVETVTGKGNVNLNSDGSFDLNTISIQMQVHSIKSDMGSIMNNNTYKALKAEANPEIIFTLNAPVKSIKPGTNDAAISAMGSLTIAGVTRPVNMQVKVFMPSTGQLAFEGSQTIKMTDYGITPPTALFGTLKTGDEITITFKTNFTSTNI